MRREGRGGRELSVNVSHCPVCPMWRTVTAFENSDVPHEARKLGVYSAKAAAWTMWGCAALSVLKGLKVLELSTQ